MISSKRNFGQSGNCTDNPIELDRMNSRIRFLGMNDGILLMKIKTITIHVKIQNFLVLITTG